MGDGSRPFLFYALCTLDPAILLQPAFTPFISLHILIGLEGS